jgi:hypothetical protein
MEQPYDFIREQKELYRPKTEPSIIEVPEMAFFAVDGKGDPNAETGAYAEAIKLLYTLSYTVKMNGKKRPLPGYFDYRVPPLEGLWQMAGGKPGVDYNDKAGFVWTGMICQPAFVDQAAFIWACGEAQKKKGLDTSSARLWLFREGLCVQMLHIGPYDAEPASVEKMDAYLARHGYRSDLGARRHHEIYLSDPGRTAPEKLKTIIRHPVAKL